MFLCPGIRMKTLLLLMLMFAGLFSQIFEGTTMPRLTAYKVKTLETKDDDGSFKWFIFNPHLVLFPVKPRVPFSSPASVVSHHLTSGKPTNHLHLPEQTKAKLCMSSSMSASEISSSCSVSLSLLLLTIKSMSVSKDHVLVLSPSSVDLSDVSQWCHCRHHVQ